MAGRTRGRTFDVGVRPPAQISRCRVLDPATLRMRDLSATSNVHNAVWAVGPYGDDMRVVVAQVDARLALGEHISLESPVRPVGG